MKKKILTILACVMLLIACTPREGIEVREAWMRPTAQGDNGAIYFVIHNYSAVGDELIGVSAEIAQAVEIHESMIMNGDVMEMQMLSSVPLAIGVDVEFSPGGLHVMLVSIKQEVQLGDEVEVVLHFKNHDDINVSVTVQEGA